MSKPEYWPVVASWKPRPGWSLRTPMITRPRCCIARERGGALDGDTGRRGLRRARALGARSALPATGGEGEGADEQPCRQMTQFHDENLLLEGNER